MRTDTVRRPWLLVGAATCALLVVVIAVLVHSRSVSFQDFDTDVGTPTEAWSYQNPAVVRVLIGIEIAFGTIATVSYLIVLLVFLWLTGRRRAAAWTLAVMVGASATTTLLKLVFHRNRPRWVDPVHTLTSFSFPSGHASGIAAGMGVIAVLTLLYVRVTAVRKVLLAIAGLLVLVVGADRVLLGVHNLSDVIAGYAVGAFWVLLMLAIYPPEPPLPRTNASPDRIDALDRPH